MKLEHRCVFSEKQESPFSFMVALVPALPIPGNLKPLATITKFAVIAASENDDGTWGYMHLDEEEKQFLGLKLVERSGVINEWVWCELFNNKDKIEKWFVYDPECDGYEEFNSEESALKHAEEYIRHYLDDGWNEDVERVTVGKVTHRATQCDYAKRPPEEELDEKNLDSEGTYWAEEWDHMCNYNMKLLGR